MKGFNSKRRVVVAAAVLMLLLFVLRPGAYRLKSRIAGSIGNALGRPVEIGNVHLRLLPRPGFDLDNLVVHEDAAFGAEPMLRAAEVTADLRLTSLAHGRLEIARLDLNEPSLNLVRGENGRWNLEALLERTAHMPLAPTAKGRSEARPAFPYIAASSGRINFKLGQEKKAYALTNADFALWQDSENTWGVRLKAQPFRTDLNLSDTGTLRVNGTWQRAPTLRETPLQFSLEWDRPQLGQLTKFLTGNDQGWRGAVQLDATLAGTPAKLKVSGDAEVRDFRRYDISGSDALRLAAHCDGQYSSVDHAVHEVLCRGPVGSGAVVLKGDVGMPGRHAYDLILTAENLPAGALVALAQRAKPDLLQDLAATGNVDGSFSLRENRAAGQDARFEGRGEVSKLRLVSAGNKVELDPPSIPFVLSAGGAGDTRPKMLKKTAGGARFPSGPHVEFGPFPVGSGRAAPPVARGWMNASGYSVSLVGEAEVARTLRLARLFRLPTLATNAEGAAQIDLQIAGSWRSGEAGAVESPQVSGTAKLRNVHVEVRGVDGPTEIASADVELGADQVRVARLSAIAAHAVWTGSLELPRGCGIPGGCLVRFNLNTNEVGVGELARWVSPQRQQRAWYRLLTPDDKTVAPLLASLHASGKVTARRLLLRNFTATQVSASVSVENGMLQIADLRADLLGGKHRGEWQVDLGAKLPVYSGSGTLTGISLEHSADPAKDTWIAGTASGSYQMAGSSSTEFWQSAEGTIQFELRDGELPHVVLDTDAEPLQVDLFQGLGHLREGKIELQDALLDSPGGSFRMSGTVSLSRELDLRLTRHGDSKAAHADAKGYAITGTLAAPRVVQVSGPETQAKLKP